MNRLCLYSFLAAACLSALVPIRLTGQEVLLTVNAGSGEAGIGRSLVDCGDFNLDGKADLALVLSAIPVGGGNYQDTLRVLSADGSILFNHSVAGIFIYGLAAMGDVNGDSSIDFALLTNVDVRIISGSDGSVLNSMVAPPSFLSGNFTEQLANVGDLNSDGVDDLAIGLPFGDSFGRIDNGLVVVLSGSNFAFIRQIDGTSSFQRLGALIQRVGDVNGDSIPEFLIGRNQDNANLNDQNEAFLISGATGATLATQSVRSYVQSIAGTLQGFKLAGGADYDGDGVADWAISASSANLGGPHSGLIRVVSGATGLVLHDHVGQPCDGIGRSISFCDVNGDGRADVVSHNTSDTPVIYKEATVFSGLTKDVMSRGIGSYVDVSKSLGLGDVNGDGYQDFAVLRNLSEQIIVYSGGPSLSYTAKTQVGMSLGQPEDVLKVNGSTGGQLHCVACGLGSPITMSIDQPAMNPIPADFVIFGRSGVPMGDESLSVPGVQGSMAIVPAPMAPWAIPFVFTLVSSVGPMSGGQIFLANPAPWSFTMPNGFAYPVEFTLEAVIMEDAFTASKTNAVIVRVH